MFDFIRRIICLNDSKLKIFKDEAHVVEEAEKNKKIYIMYKDSVYDCTNYLDKHPGGKQILVQANGKIVDKVFDKYHYPLGSSPSIMKKLKVGEIRRETE